jgi:hypothetical protein
MVPEARLADGFRRFHASDLMPCLMIWFSKADAGDGGTRGDQGRVGPDEFSIGPGSSLGQPDLCFAATAGENQKECWRFDGEVYVRDTANAGG